MNLSLFFRKHLLNCVFLLLSAIIMIAFLFLSRYALPTTDDFADMMFGFQKLNATGNVYRSVYQTSRDIYFGQQGTFFSCFSLFFLLIKTGTNLIRYQMIIAALMLFFFASIGYLVYTIAKHYQLTHIWGIFLFTALWVAMDYVPCGDSMLYIVGACVYTLPLSFGFLSIAFYLKTMYAQQHTALLFWTILSSGCAFLCSGGVLMAAGMINIVMVLMFLSRWITTRRFPLRGLIPFLFAFGSALINTLAPGNFARYMNAYGTRPSIRHGILQTFVITSQQFLQLFKHTYLLIALIIIAVTLLCMRQEISKEHFQLHPMLVLLAGYVACYVVMFPSVLGYSLAISQRVEDRIKFTFAWVAMLAIVFGWSYLMCWIRIHILPRLKVENIPISLGIITLFVALVLNPIYIRITRVDTHPTLTTIYKEYHSGALEQYYAAYHLMLLGAEAAETSSHYVVTYEIPMSALFMNHPISADNTWWVNTSMAAVYQLSAFTYGPDHPFTEEDALEAGYTIEQLLP